MARPSQETKTQSADRDFQKVDCAIVIVTYNSAGYIDALLNSVAPAAVGVRFRIVVVDNGSRDETCDLVRRYPDVCLVETGTNLGYAAAINVGRMEAREYSSLLVLNPDVVLGESAITEMLAILGDPQVGIVVPMLLNEDGSRFHSLRREPRLTRAFGDSVLGAHMKGRPGWLGEVIWDEGSYVRRHDVDWATGAVLLVSADCDAAVGQWDERFFLYSEETDYAWRVRAAGYRIVYCPSARAYHSGGGSSRSRKLVALLAVSRIRYIEKRGRHARAYRLVVALNELLRVCQPAHRWAFRVVVRRSAWDPLISGLRGEE